MNPNFTQNDLILFIYNELVPAKAELLRRALATDKLLQEAYQALMHSLRHLQNIQLCAPSDKLAASILNYANSAKLAV